MFKSLTTAVVLLCQITLIVSDPLWPVHDDDSKDEDSSPRLKGWELVRKRLLRSSDCGFDLCSVNPCAADERCIMTTCYSIMCIPADDPATDGNSTDDGPVLCPFDLCSVLNPCGNDLICQMLDTCDGIRCLDNPPQTTTRSPSTGTSHYENSSLRPLSERACSIPTLVCRHGYCNHLSCVCDEGWTGLLCTHRCDLECGLGVCINISGKMVCNCPHNYKGPHCENKDS